MAKAPPFEKSKWDNDTGVKEGSKNDRKRDAKERKRQLAAKEKGRVKK